MCLSNAEEIMSGYSVLTEANSLPNNAPERIVNPGSTQRVVSSEGFEKQAARTEPARPAVGPTNYSGRAGPRPPSCFSTATIHTCSFVKCEAPNEEKTGSPVVFYVDNPAGAPARRFAGPASVPLSGR